MERIGTMYPLLCIPVGIQGQNVTMYPVFCMPVGILGTNMFLYHLLVFCWYSWEECVHVPCTRCFVSPLEFWGRTCNLYALLVSRLVSGAEYVPCTPYFVSPLEFRGRICTSTPTLYPFWDNVADCVPCAPPFLSLLAEYMNIERADKIYLGW